MEVTIHHTENLPELVSMLLVCSSVDTKDLCSMIEYVDKMNKVATAIQGHTGMLEKVNSPTPAKHGPSQVISPAIRCEAV